MFQIYSFIKYWFKASDEHSIHSPFLFNLYNKVINNCDYSPHIEIELLRKLLLKREEYIDIKDYGTGPDRKATIKEIAKKSLSPARFSQLQYRMVQNFKPINIVEIGTSLGLNTAYLAKANVQSKVYSFEGCPNIALVAKSNFDQLNIRNIEVITGDFNVNLVPALQHIKKVDYAFIDGNHTYEATVSYFDSILRFSSENAIIIVDDIYWSNEMHRAWKVIKQNANVTLSIDLFHLGIIFLDKKLSKQNLILKF